MCSSTARHSTAHAARRPLLIGAIVLLGACANADAPSPLAPSSRDAAPGTALADEAATTAAPDVDAAIRTLRRATASYQNLDNAIADGFVLLHDCEVRPEEGAVGTVYVNVARLLDGAIDPTRPDALIYEPSDDGRLALVGAEHDRYAFRTSPLRNVSLQPAIMHNGAFTALDQAMRYHLDAVGSSTSYTPEHLPADLRGPIGPLQPVLARLDPRLRASVTLSEAEFDPGARPESLRRLIPERLPSGRTPLLFR